MFLLLHFRIWFEWDGADVWNWALPNAGCSSLLWFLLFGTFTAVERRALVSFLVWLYFYVALFHRCPGHLTVAVTWEEFCDFRNHLRLQIEGSSLDIFFVTTALIKHFLNSILNLIRLRVDLLMWWWALLCTGRRIGDMRFLLWIYQFVKLLSQ